MVNQDVVAVVALRRALNGDATPTELNAFWQELCGSLHPTTEWPELKRIIETSKWWNHRWDSARGEWIEEHTHG